MKILPKNIPLCLCLALLCCTPVSASASGIAVATARQAPAYQQELNLRLSEALQLNTSSQKALVELENELRASKEALNEANKELTLLQKQLAQSQMGLQRANEELKTLKLELAQLKETSAGLENSWKNANEYLKQMAEEEKRTRLRVKRQRNFWEAVAAASILAIVVKTS